MLLHSNLFIDISDVVCICDVSISSRGQSLKSLNVILCVVTLHGVRSSKLQARIMEQLKLPVHLSMEGNLAENWKEWIQGFDIYLTATGIGVKNGIGRH